MTKSKYRKILLCILASIILFSGIFYLDFLQNHIPDNIYLEPYKDNNIDLNLPFLGSIDVYYDEKEVAAASVNFLDNISISGTEEKRYAASVKLFGLVKVKNVNVIVKEPEEIIPFGIPIGIHLDTNGVMIVDTGNVITASGEIESPARGILKKGDYVLAVDGNIVNNKNEMLDYIEKSNGIVNLKINRDGVEINVKIKTVTDEIGNEKIGAWIRDDCQGLGTLTYVNKDMEFGALGHAICEENTGEIVKIKDGYIYTAKIWSIIKGKKGKPGEIVGSINYSDDSLMGIVTKNCEKGIYGMANHKINTQTDSEYLKIAYKQDVKKGKAYIRSFVSGTVDDYEINIKELIYSEKEKNKGIVFEITDEKLLNITNGIVQGMSGSPIIQDGKVVGAVTHVFVNNPRKGYGIFIENMLEE